MPRNIKRNTSTNKKVQPLWRNPFILGVVVLGIIGLGLFIYNSSIAKPEEHIVAGEEVFRTIDVNGRSIELSFWNNTEEDYQFDHELLAKRIELMEAVSQRETGYVFTDYTQIRFLIENVLDANISGVVNVEGKVAQITLNPIVIQMETQVLYIDSQMNMEAVLMDELSSLVTWGIPNVDHVGATDTSELPAWHDSEVFSFGIYTAIASILVNERTGDPVKMYEFVFLEALTMRPMPPQYQIDDNPIYGAEISETSFVEIFDSYRERKFILTEQP